MSGKLRKRMLIGLSLLLVILILVVLSLAYQEVARWLYPPDYEGTAQSADTPFEEIIFQTSDDLTIYGWYSPPQNGTTILMLSGHGGDRNQLLPHAEYLIPEGYGILSIDFRNRGKSDGDKTSMGFHEVKDALAAYQFLLEQPEVEKIVLFGHSMGGAIASRLMQDVNADGLVIYSTFADFPSIVSAGVLARGYPDPPISQILLGMYSLLSGADFNVIHPEAQFPNFTIPILLMHGTNDPVIPIEHAYRLAEANPLVQLEIYNGGEHSNLYEIDPDRYRTDFLQYLSHLQ